MQDIVTSNGGELTTTSKVVSDVFGKAHRDVIRDIRRLDCSDEFSLRNFAQSEYKTGRGKVYQCYNITEEGFYFLCMGFTGKKAAEWKEAFIAEFKRLRAGSLNVDQRMTEISNSLNKIKEDGKKWSEIGRQINRNKKDAVEASKRLLDDVQLKLEY